MTCWEVFSPDRIPYSGVEACALQRSRYHSELFNAAGMHNHLKVNHFRYSFVDTS